ncbi:hypothetical protein HFN_2300 [Helicobacter fennelliae MRY12-0050]|uniref:Uncharacterized protein n=1 Tax=Helicobacter fennelliae MRY12-0050 TaxID=1325130 RepID=T1DVA2_9HELI|nr:hypothetical protein HFN_2300 [Helicobacter fennelliae MRY12-0050]
MHKLKHKIKPKPPKHHKSHKKIALFWDTELDYNDFRSRNLSLTFLLDMLKFLPDSHIELLSFQVPKNAIGWGAQTKK